MVPVFGILLLSLGIILIGSAIITFGSKESTGDSWLDDPVVRSGIKGLAGLLFTVFGVFQLAL